MSVPHLSVVRSEENRNSPAARAAELYAEAQTAAFEQVRLLEESLTRVADLAAEIADGGEVYPAGIRDLCRRMVGDLTQRSLTLDAIASRALEHR